MQLTAKPFPYVLISFIFVRSISFIYPSSEHVYAL